MPFIAWWPGKTPAGRFDETTVIGGVDMLPTLAAIGKAKLPADIQPDGEDLSAALFGKDVERHKSLLWEYGRNEKSFKYPGDKDNRSPNVALREGRWKLIVNADGTQRELYDLDVDPNETTNLATSQHEVAQRLSDKALQWRTSLPKFEAKP
jgi:arylsulfatase A-like enzyme